MTWGYSPNYFLGDTQTLIISNYEFDVSENHIMVTIPADVYDNTTRSFGEIKKIIETLFDVAMVSNNENYSITCKGINNYPSSGKPGIVLWPEDCVSVSFIESISIKQYDENGKLVYDCEKEERDRIESERNKKLILASELVDLRSSLTEVDVSDKLVNSYKESLKNNNYALVHLYEIRDTLNVLFKHKKNAIKVLNIVEKDWDKIGEMANSKAVKGSRHEGKFFGPLSEANEQFIFEARKSAQKLILAYLKYMQNQL